MKIVLSVQKNDYYSNSFWRIKSIITIVFVLIVNNCNAREDYYNILREAEQCIIDNNLDSSLYYYDKAFLTYNYPFVRDIVSAVHIAGYLNNTVVFEKYIILLAKKGVSMYDIKLIIGKFISNDKADSLLAKCNNLVKHFDNSIDEQLSRMFKVLDINNQLYVIYGKRRNELHKIKNHIEILDSTLASRYIRYVREYGYPTEHRVGLGSLVIIKIGKKTQFKKYADVEEVNNIEISIPKNKSILCLTPNGNVTKSVQLLSRRGNGFLWHLDIKKYKELDNILTKGIDSLCVYPEFYASCLERHGVDYALAWQSELNQKYKFDLKKIVHDPKVMDVNKRRAKIGLRSVEMDIKLFNAIAKLENLKYKKCFSRKSKVRNLLFRSLFISKIP